MPFVYRRSPLAWVLAIAGLLAIVPCGGALVAVWRDFVQFGARSKQAECKHTLSRLVAAERSYFAAHQRYTTKVHELDFSVEYNRYAYLLDSKGPLEDRSAATPVTTPDDVGVNVSTSKYVTTGVSPSDAPRVLAGGEALGLHGTCPESCFLVMACIGQLDLDGTLDVWSVSTADRYTSDDEIRAGSPFNDVNDVVH